MTFILSEYEVDDSPHLSQLVYILLNPCYNSVFRGKTLAYHTGDSGSIPGSATNSLRMHGSPLNTVVKPSGPHGY